MDSHSVTAEETVELISSVLQEEYPSSVFAVRLEDPILTRRDIRGVDVIWVDGPDRDQVEEVLDRFQGVSWDPRTGELDTRSHLIVTTSGDLKRVFYNIDYIFCDGPIPAIHI